MTNHSDKKDRFWLKVIFLISIVICAVVFFLILGPRPATTQKIDVSFLPLVNASLNSITTFLLVLGFIFIKQKNEVAHKNTMLAAFFTSTLFLVSYVIYHWFKDGPKLYTGDWRLFYYTILISHILLAITIVPLALISFYWGWKNNRIKHKQIVRFAFPVWIYVSITGVLIYVMLYL